MELMTGKEHAVHQVKAFEKHFRIMSFYLASAIPGIVEANSFAEAMEACQKVINLAKTRDTTGEPESVSNTDWVIEELTDIFREILEGEWDDVDWDTWE